MCVIGDDILLEPASNKVLYLIDVKTRPRVAIRRFGTIPDVLSWLLIWPQPLKKKRETKKNFSYTDITQYDTAHCQRT